MASILDWLEENFFPIVVSIVTIIIGYFLYLIIKKQLQIFHNKKRLTENAFRDIVRIIKMVITLVIFTIVLTQFAESLGFVTALFTLMGGTIVGFAAINTLGNFIAGIIIMTSKPFANGDRILYQGEFVDVTEINLMYTHFVNLDHVKISVPNQKLLNEEIVNYGKNKPVRRAISITPGFNEDRKKVEMVLLEAVQKIPEVLPDPTPYVWITAFQNYAVEYRVFVFISEIKDLPRIDSDLHKVILDSCSANGIDISTPLLLRNTTD